MAAYLEKMFNLGSFSSSSKNIEVNKDGTTWVPFGSLADFEKEDYLNQFMAVPELNNIINLRAKYLTDWDLELQSKATGKQVSNNETLVRIIRKPNFFQTQVEMWRQSEIYRSIYGNEFIYFLTPVGMPNTYKAMFSLDPTKVKVEYNPSDLFFNDAIGESVKYKYNHNGTEYELDKKNVIHLNSNNVGWRNILKGSSKLKPLQPAIQNIIEAYNKRNIMLKMPIGIMTSAAQDGLGVSMPLDPDEKRETYTALKTKRGLPIITNLNTKYTTMVNSPVQMGLFEEVREDTIKICDAFGIPYELLGNQKGTTFTNLKEAKKQMYEETIFPDANEKVSALNDRFAGKTWELTYNYSHLSIFSDNKKERAISLKQMVEALSKAYTDGAITIEEYKSEMKKFKIGV